MRKRVALFVACLACCGPAIAAQPETSAQSASSAAEAAPSPAAPPVVVADDYLAARFAALHHDLPKAADLFRRSLEQDKNNAQLLSSAFFYAVAAGRVEDGAQLAKRLNAVLPGQRVAYLTLASVAMKHGDYRSARDNIAQSYKGAMVSSTVKLLDAWASAGAGDFTAATKTIQSLRSLQGAEAVANFNLALLADFHGDAAAAQQAYESMLRGSDASPRLIDAYGRFLERAGKMAEAKRLYEKAVNDPSVQPVAEAGLTRLASGRKASALVTTPEEGAAEAMMGIATTISDENGADVSILFLQLAKYLRPDFELADLLLADRFESVGNYEAAIAIYARLPESSPYWRVARMQSATDKMLTKQDAAATKDMQVLADRYPNDINVWMTYGDVLRQGKDYQQTVVAYSKAVALLDQPAKKNWSLFFARANAYQSAGDWPKAEADLKTALKLNPEEPQILNFLGYSWVDQRRNLSQGVEMLEKAHKLSPNDGYITDSVGWAYYRLGRLQDASVMLELAVELVPQDPTINDHLGDVYWKMGRTLDARFQWSHALAFGPEEEDKAKIAKKLESIPENE